MKLVASSALLALLLAGWDQTATTTSAFVPQRATTKSSSSSTTTTTTTSLSVLPPPLIISPIIKKMREEKAKQNQPMVEADEAMQEAPGLRVGKGVWKWPAFWPYDDAIFKSSGEAEAIKKKQQMDAMASMLSGTPQLPTPGEAEKKMDLQFDPLQYWGEEQENATTVMADKEVQEKLKSHFGYYFPKNEDLSILELGAAEDSYLPTANEDVQIVRHVGVSATPQLMDQNPSLTDTMVVDLNKVVPDRDIDDDNLRRLAQDPFDIVLLTNTVEYLTNPREVFRSAWYLLKPGGTMFVTFRGKDVTKNDFSEAQTAIWRQYNDDQHMWITGSFFQFSAGDGWESLMGFDISPESAKPPEDNNPLTGLVNRGTGQLLYVVQATKGYQDDSIDLENLERSIGSLTWMLPSMEDRDKKLVVPRLVRCLEAASDKAAMKEAMEKNIPHLPAIYEQALVKMDQFAFTFSMQSQMAAELVCDADFEANEAQMTSLREGLGLKPPGDDFWLPVGQATAAMGIEDKISLLGYLVPRFGSNNAAQEEALQAFVTGLKPTYAAIRAKCPELEEADVELLGTDFLAVEVLKPGVTTRQEFAAWVASLEATEIRDYLQERKAVRVNAKDEVKDYKDAREERKKRVEELRAKMEEQMKKAREERSLIFNPRTEKMEVFSVK